MPLVYIDMAKLDQASTQDNEVNLMMRRAPEWVRTSDPVIRSFSTTSDCCARPRLYERAVKIITPGIMNDTSKANNAVIVF